MKRSLVIQTKDFLFPISYFLIAYFNISSIDINQCANNEQPFGNTHKCPMGARVTLI